MSDRYSEELAERDRFIAWIENDNGPIDTSGEMSPERHWHFSEPFLNYQWCIWASATGYR